MEELKGKILAGKILVKPQEAEEKTQSGIIIPDSAKEKPRTTEMAGTSRHNPRVSHRDRHYRVPTFRRGSVRWPGTEPCV